MLWVYSGLHILDVFDRIKQDLPEDYINLSKLSTEELPKAVTDYCDHHSNGHIFLGYLDPLLMMHPIQETVLRRGFDTCTMSVIVSNPFLLPLSWKNGTEKIVILESEYNDAKCTKTFDNGSVAHVQHEVKDGPAPDPTSIRRNTDKGRKKRSSKKGGEQTGQDKA